MHQKNLIWNSFYWNIETKALSLFGCLPEFLNGRLFLPRNDNVPRVVDGKEQNVPVAAEPWDEEGAWERLEGQLNHLGGTDPGGGHAQHHQQSPQHLHGGVGACLIGVALPARLTSQGLCVGLWAFLSWEKRENALQYRDSYHICKSLLHFICAIKISFSLSFLLLI